jgi:hypothetical protein
MAVGYAVRTLHSFQPTRPDQFFHPRKISTLEKHLVQFRQFVLLFRLNDMATNLTQVASDICGFRVHWLSQLHDCENIKPFKSRYLQS